MQPQFVACFINLTKIFEALNVGLEWGDQAYFLASDKIIGDSKCLGIKGKYFL